MRLDRLEGELRRQARLNEQAALAWDRLAGDPPEPGAMNAGMNAGTDAGADAGAADADADADEVARAAGAGEDRTGSSRLDR